jgi:hypothetical protein
MAHISLDEAAARSGVPRQTLEAWAEQGLLSLTEGRDLSRLAPGVPGPQAAEKFVDEEELERVMESLGWLELSSGGWEEPEEA